MVGRQGLELSRLLIGVRVTKQKGGNKVAGRFFQRNSVATPLPNFRMSWQQNQFWNIRK